MRGMMGYDDSWTVAKGKHDSKAFAQAAERMKFLFIELHYYEA